jgi:hypothetical protein
VSGSHPCHVLAYVCSWSCPGLSVRPTWSGCLVQAVLSQLSCSVYAVMAVLSQVFLSRLPVPVSLSRHVQSVLSSFSCHGTLPWLSCSDRPLPRPVLSPLFYPGCSVPAVLSQLSCPPLPCHSCSVPAALSQLFCPRCPVTAVFSSLPCHSCSVPAALSQLSCPRCPVPAIFSPTLVSPLSCPCRHVLAVLFFLFCQG